ncbi:MAG: radical SAM protein [Desulfovibrionaceae bacterium]|nr:radical SAM protein [Desulfovibrionaceae bacterium]
MAPPHTLIFRHPEGPRPAFPVRPVFLPNAGCPGKCIYCVQEVQTGRAALALGDIYEHLRRELDRAAAAAHAPFELGFYGGTFTALPEDYAARFVALAAAYKQGGPVAAVRCSTRPDAAGLPLLRELAALGLDSVELGGQSFDDAALAASRRGYDGAAARAACEAVREAGLNLGVQLLPGLPSLPSLPGHAPEAFRRDIEILLEIKPGLVRLYPCLVIEGSALAAMHDRGEYAPWPLETAASEIARALPPLWRAGVRVARLGLAPQPGLLGKIKAGPWHASLGSLTRGRALYAMLAQSLDGRRMNALRLPRRYQGELFGFGGELIEPYARLGLKTANAKPWDQAHFALETA